MAARDRQDNPIVTGFEAVAAPLAEVCYDFGRDRTTLMVATNVALALFGAEALEEARSALLEVFQGRYRQLRGAVQVSIGHPRQNDGGARDGGDRGREPPTTPPTSEPTRPTSEPTTTTSEPTTTTSGGTEIEHACCPQGAPYKWGFVVSGPHDCDGWSGDMVWTGTAWTAQTEGCVISLTCSRHEDIEGDYNGWELHLTIGETFCSWISYEDSPYGFHPDCGIGCESGATFDWDGPCFATGPGSYCGSVQVWPK